MALSKGKASLNALFHKYLNRAKRFGRSFQLSQEKFQELTQQNCYYCGASPKQNFCQRNCNGGCLYNGVDRVDNSKGYEDGNVVTCCGTCNKMKGTYSQEEFLEQVKKIYENPQGENRKVTLRRYIER